MWYDVRHVCVCSHLSTCRGSQWRWRRRGCSTRLQRPDPWTSTPRIRCTWALQPNVDTSVRRVTVRRPSPYDTPSLCDTSHCTTPATIRCPSLSDTPSLHDSCHRTTPVTIRCSSLLQSQYDVCHCAQHHITPITVRRPSPCDIRHQTMSVTVQHLSPYDVRRTSPYDVHHRTTHVVVRCHHRHTLGSYSIRRCIMLYYAVLCCIMLHYAALCCIMLYYAVSCMHVISTGAFKHDYSNTPTYITFWNRQCIDRLAHTQHNLANLQVTIIN